jgi:predicted Fe-Mo cluster-binding NifX family protein
MKKLHEFQAPAPVVAEEEISEAYKVLQQHGLTEIVTKRMTAEEAVEALKHVNQ